MGPDGQPCLSLPRTPGSTVPQCDISFIGSICALISASFSVERSFGTPFLWSGRLGWVSPYISIRGPETVISNRESLSWLQLLLYDAITPIAHGEDVLLQRAKLKYWVSTPQIPQVQTRHSDDSWLRSRFSFPFHVHVCTPPQHESRAPRGAGSRSHTVSISGNEASNLPARTKDGPYTRCHYSTMIASSWYSSFR